MAAKDIIRYLLGSESLKDQLYKFLIVWLSSDICDRNFKVLDK